MSTRGVGLTVVVGVGRHTRSVKVVVKGCRRVLAACWEISHQPAEGQRLRSWRLPIFMPFPGCVLARGRASLVVRAHKNHLLDQALGTSRVHLPLLILGGSRLLHMRWHRSCWMSHGNQELSLQSHPTTAYHTSELLREGLLRTNILHVCCLIVLDVGASGRLS